MQRLKDKAIIITGAATGTGPAIASACVADADGLLLVDHNPAVMDVVGASGGVGCSWTLRHPGRADGDRPYRVTLGRLDGLVNNAARVDEADIAGMTTRCSMPG